MKLRNKRTGEIVEPFGITCINGRTFVQFDDGAGTFKFEARSLAELNEEWEDYEEPKDFWYIDYCGCICNSEEDPVSPVFMLKQIGNYFETKEEAEKAVEKLKAWKQLKARGFKFNSCKIEMSEIIWPEITITAFIDTEDPGTLNLVKWLFGGEE